MPAIYIKQDRVKAIKRKHPWIFSKAISKVEGDPKLGENVDVFSVNGEWLATAAYSPHSQIRARIWSFDREEAVDLAFFENKIARAIAIRQPIIERSDTNAYRLLCAESDGLPGVTVDVYQDTIVCQMLSAGAEFHKQNIFDALLKAFPDFNLYERSDVDVRSKEGLKKTSGLIAGELKQPIEIKENGIKALVNIVNGHKTGYYNDQRDNRLALEKYCKDADVLNCFSYTGTFGLYAARGGANHITQVDMSADALNIAEQNAQLNKLDLSTMSFIKADVFKLLRQYREENKRFDVIVMDPPKFVENKGQLRSASRGYKDINMLAMQLINPGGYLLSFSCSGLMDAPLFQKIVADAALDAKREMVFVEKLHQAQDHVIGSAYPEGYYLKGFVCQVF